MNFFCKDNNQFQKGSAIEIGSYISRLNLFIYLCSSTSFFGVGYKFNTE